MECKRCPTCGQNKPMSDFPGKTASYCKPCSNAYQREYRKAKPDVHRAARKKYRANNPDYSRRAALGKYKLTPECWDQMLAEQGGRCAICRTDQPRGHNWHIDHDHACCPGIGRCCGRCIRGLLCGTCNLMLGCAEDDPARLMAAARYLGERSMVHAKKKSGDPDFDDKVPLSEQLGEQVEVDGETVTVTKTVGPVGPDGSHRNLEPIEVEDTRPDAKNADVPDGLESVEDRQHPASAASLSGRVEDASAEPGSKRGRK